MSAMTLAVSVLGSVITATLYLYIGSTLRRRSVSPEARLAQEMFVLWWRTLGAIGLLGAAITLTYMAGALEVWMYRVFLTLGLLGIFTALWGLQFYLVYLYTGSKRWFVPLGAFYALLFIGTLALMEYLGDPERIVDNGWSIRTEPRPELGGVFSLAFVLLLLGPQMLAAIAYARLYRKTSDPTQRYRIALVTGSILVWFGSSLLASALELSSDPAWQVVSRLIGVAGALGILAAYRPPRWIRDRYGIRSIDDDDRVRSVPA